MSKHRKGKCDAPCIPVSLSTASWEEGGTLQLTFPSNLFFGSTLAAVKRSPCTGDLGHRNHMKKEKKKKRRSLAQHVVNV